MGNKDYIQYIADDYGVDRKRAVKIIIRKRNFIVDYLGLSRSVAKIKLDKKISGEIPKKKFKKKFNINDFL